MHRTPLARLRRTATLAGAVLVLGACASAGSATDADSGPPTASLAPTTSVAKPTTTTPSTTAPRRTTTTSTTTTSTTTAPTTTVAPVADGGSTTVPTYAPTSAVAQARPNRAGDPFAAFDASIVSSLFGRGALTVSVAVAKDGELVHAQAYGTTNPFTGDAASVDDRFRIASVSKTLLAVAVLRFVDEGKLALDQPVGDRLIGILDTTPGDPAIATITVRQLLSHTSGFAEYQRTFFGGDVSSCEEAAAAALRRPLVGAPGTVYGYSNLNYCLLGLLVEDVTGESYEAVVQQEVLDPLDIDDMRVAGTFDVRDGDVVHPTGQGRTFMEALGASGNWIGTATDLVKVVDALDPAKPGPHLLGPTWLPEMTVRAPVTYPHVDSWYGLGLIVWDNGTAWGHTGTVESARTMVFHRPDGITWSILVNGPAPSYSADLRKYMDKALATVTSWPA